MLHRGQLAVIVAALAVPFAARAEQLMFMFPLDPGQEVQTPSVDSTGSGLGHVMYDTDTNVIDWSISFQNLVSPVSMAHFHGPASVGQNASIILGVATTAVTAGLLEGSGAFPESREQALLDGLVYFNIHTNTYPGGEIRGQVVPEPATAILGMLSAAVVLARRTRRKTSH